MIYQRDCPVQCLNRMMINLVIVTIAMLPCIPLKSITGWHANGMAIAAQQITAKEALEWASQEAGISYVAFELPHRQAKPPQAFEEEDFKRWLESELDCDVIYYDKLWLISGRHSKGIRKWTPYPRDWLEWFCIDVLGMDKRDVPYDQKQYGSAYMAEVARILERVKPLIPQLAEDEVAVVPIELKRKDYPTLLQAVDCELLHSAASVLRTAVKPIMPQYRLRLHPKTQLLELCDPSEPPQIRMVLGPIKFFEGEWRKRTIARKWGYFWRHWSPKLVWRWSELLRRPVTIAMDASFEEVIATVSKTAKVGVKVANSLKRQRITLNVRDMPLWLLFHSLSAVSGAQWKPWRDASVYEFDIADAPSSRFYAEHLTVEMRMLWLKESVMAESLTPYFFSTLTPNQREAIVKGWDIYLNELDDDQMLAFRKFALTPARVRIFRSGLRKFERWFHSNRVHALVLYEYGKEPWLWMKAESSNDWSRREYRFGKSKSKKRPLEKRPLALHIFGEDRRRKFAFIFQNYGNESAIPPRAIFGSWSKPAQMRIPHFVAGTVKPAKPTAIISKRQFTAGSAKE